jgi:eukaryotic-like serine/threonine-protein kinase
MNLHKDDWLQALHLLDQAIALPPADRKRWANGLSLQGRQRALLNQLLDERMALEAGHFMRSLPVATPAAEPAAEEGRAGAQIGAYRLLLLLAEGGMSTVWLAERVDGAARRSVVLKLPHTGPGREWLASHLAREQDILASLEHRNIARLYDLGVTRSGLPFMVLEHVRGCPLPEYCNARKLGVAQRLGLFLQVLRAVQYAHARLVLHRDLKPSNILVSNDGDVKLLDFGIARLISPTTGDDSSQAYDNQAVFTPEYAAPEQIARQPLGTACDIYALGVILHELLCAQRPYRLSRGPQDELEAAMRRVTPSPPSEVWCTKKDAHAFGNTPAAMRRALAGDIDAIVGMAMHKEPLRRYASAESFAEDIQRHLAHQAVRARSADRRYRAARFLRRHVLAIASGTIVATALLAGTSVALWSAREAHAEAAKATAVKAFLIDLLDRSAVAGAPDEARSGAAGHLQTLQHSADALDQGLHEQSAVRQELMGVVGRHLNDIAVTDRAARLQEQRVKLLETMRADPAEQGAALRDLAETLEQRGDHARASEVLLQTVAMVARDERPEAQIQRWAAEGTLGRMDLFRNRFDIARGRIESAATQLGRLAPGSPLEARTLEDLAILRHEQGRHHETAPLLQRSFQIMSRVHAGQPAKLARERYAHAMLLTSLLNDVAGAVVHLEAALAETQASAGPDSVNRALIEQQLGRLLIYQGRIPAAQQHLERANAVLATGANQLDPVHLLKGRLFMVEALIENGRLEQARSAMNDALALRQQMSFDSDEWPIYSDYLQAKLDTQTGRYEQALAMLHALEKRFAALYAEKQFDQIDLRLRIAAVHQAAGDSRSVSALLDRETALAKTAESLPDWWQERMAPLRIELMIGQRNFNAALPLALQQLEAVESKAAASRMAQQLPAAMHRLARVYAGLGRASQALPLFERSMGLLEALGYAHNPALAAVRSDYAGCLADAGRIGEAQAQWARADAALSVEPSAGRPYRQAFVAASTRLRGMVSKPVPAQTHARAD